MALDVDAAYSILDNIRANVSHLYYFPDVPHLRLIPGPDIRYTSSLCRHRRDHRDIWTAIDRGLLARSCSHDDVHATTPLSRTGFFIDGSCEHSVQCPLDPSWNQCRSSTMQRTSRPTILTRSLLRPPRSQPWALLSHIRLIPLSGLPDPRLKANPTLQMVATPLLRKYSGRNPSYVIWFSVDRQSGFTPT